MASTPRSFSRSGGLIATPSTIQSCILLDAALERCGSVSSEIDASAVASSATCCDIELAKLAQACWTCSKPESTGALCAAATSEADIALGMSTCMSRMPISSSSLLESRLRTQTFSRRGSDGDQNYRPSTLFLVAFFVAVAVLAIGIIALVLHRCRKARPYQRRAHRRAVLDLMEGFTPVEEKQDAAALTRPGTPMPEQWVRFHSRAGSIGHGYDDIVSPPPLARSRSPSPTLDDMYEISHSNSRRGVRPVAHGIEVPQLLLTTPPRFENGAAVLESPMLEPVPIRRY